MHNNQKIYKKWLITFTTILLIIYLAYYYFSLEFAFFCFVLITLSFLYFLIIWLHESLSKTTDLLREIIEKEELIIPDWFHESVFKYPSSIHWLREYSVRAKEIQKTEMEKIHDLIKKK